MAVLEYITLAELKGTLGIPADDDTEDNRLERVRRSASRSVDTHCHRRFYLDDAVSQRTYRPSGRVVVDRRAGEYKLLVDDIATTTGLIVETGSLGSATWAAVTGYDTDPENAIVQGRAIEALIRTVPWPCLTGSRVRVTAKWGWPSIPDLVVEATLLTANRLFRRKDSPEGVTASSDWGPIRVVKLDPDVQKMLTNFVLPAFG